MSGYYPYLLCGLPDLNFNMNLEGFSYQELYDQVFELLSPADRKLAELFLSFPMNREVAEKYLALQDDPEKREAFLEDCSWPDYQKGLFRHKLAYWLYGDEDAPVEKMEEEELRLRLKKMLDEAFYARMEKYRNAFVRRWFEFDLVLKNTLVAFAARKRKRAAEKDFVSPRGLGNRPDENEAEPELISWIKENMQQGDFGLKLRLSYAEELFSALELEDVYLRERRVDQFRWKMLDEMLLEKDFQMDVVLAYLQKLQILRRWKEMDAEAGRKYLQETVSRLRKVDLGGEPPKKHRGY